MAIGLCFALASCAEKMPEEAHIELKNDGPYWTYAIKAADHFEDNLDEFLEKWRLRYEPKASNHFSPPISEIYLAALYANLYDTLGKSHTGYLKAAKRICLQYGEYKSLFLPKDSLLTEYTNGIPTIPNFFLVPKYARTCEVLFESDILSTNERKQIEQELALNADYLMVTQEWGPMNRAMLRAEGLLYISKLLPKHAHNPEWRQMGEAILADNLENWSIEDAGMYGMIWMYSLCGYAHHVAENDQLLNTPMARYYFDYYKELMSPAGVIPDFGDAWWRSWWYASVPVFECGAKVFNSSELKWAAQYTYDQNSKNEELRASLALKYVEAALWASQSLSPQVPHGRSKQVLDDQIGKKVVFRNGYEGESTYLLLNYKDEGTDGWNYREHLRNTLSVNHEKMHHGHSDENAIAFWMHENTILLRDGGYRDAIPSGANGSYRADIFHNRLVGRNAEPKGKGPIIDFLKNDGFYKNVSTQKIDFYSSSHVDHSRTRIIDNNQGFTHDRIVDYVKAYDFFVVSDFVNITRSGPFTFSTLWHGQHVLDSGSNWVITRYDSIGKWENPGEERLYLRFLQPNPLNTEIAQINRHRQTENVISNTQSRYFEKGEKVLFATVLMPLDRATPLPKPENISLTSTSENAICVRVAMDNTVILLAHKIDLKKDVIREWPRPKYTATSGSIEVGPYSTDAQSLFVIENREATEVTAANLTHLQFRDTPVFEQPPVTNEYSLDGSKATSAPWKVRLVERTIPRN